MSRLEISWQKTNLVMKGHQEAKKFRKKRTQPDNTLGFKLL
ncbi:MAG: hypothetical protein WBA23_08740 [Tunicatimonas sp.]